MIKNRQQNQLKHGIHTFHCAKNEYPFPGFTNDNIVCCFKKSQLNKPSYIRNTGNNIVNKVPMSVKQFASKSGINPEVLMYLASKPSISQNSAFLSQYKEKE